MVIDSDLDAPSFSVRTAYYLAHACQAAYLDTLGDWAVELALGPTADTFQFGAFHGFVANMERVSLVAFRGTDNIENWVTDGHTVQVEDKTYPGKVHQGFAEAMGEIWPGLRERLPAPAGSRPVWVTGHSLGGALATLAAIRLESEGYTVRAAYTYGSPRVGNLDFYEAYQPINYRFVNNNDVVPHVPLEFMVLGVRHRGLVLFRYKHVGTLKYLDRHGHLGEGMSDWDMKKEFTLNALMRSGGTIEPDALADHRIDNYVRAIATNLPSE
ncbi:MAG TPA: lipase family protein [Gemmataceae bacterium]|nr:lipase family protein [Gemmataceae bacterium]